MDTFTEEKKMASEIKPFVSEAQRRKFQELVKSGKIKQEVYDAMQQATGDKPLPERVTK